MSLERRLTALEQRQPPEIPQEIPPPHTREEVALWWAERYNWTRAAQTLDITEAQAIEQWGEQTGWRELQAGIKELTEQAQALCTIREQQPEKPPEEQPPPELRDAPLEMRMDRRRWRAIQKQRRKGRGRSG